jgi:hypothetical protein
MLTYHEAMRIGAARYADVIELLTGAGLPTTFTQTGGMCAALEIQLETGHTLLVTDAEDTLAWDRSKHQGWGVGLYPPDNADSNEALAFHSTPSGSATDLLPLIHQVLSSSVKHR